MLALFFVFVVLFWMFVGAVQFLVCVAIPRLRRYALSAALWWAFWGPCSVALMLLAGVALLGEQMARERWDIAALRDGHFPVSLGWGYLVVGVVVTVVVASVVAWIHQVVVHRFTFALFRLYAMAVVGGIGSVFGWVLSWWIVGAGVPFGWALSVVAMAVLVGGFGAAAYRGARGLRGGMPARWAWASKEEFEGIPERSR